MVIQLTSTVGSIINGHDRNFCSELGVMTFSDATQALTAQKLLPKRKNGGTISGKTDLGMSFFIQKQIHMCYKVKQIQTGIETQTQIHTRDIVREGVHTRVLCGCGMIRDSFTVGPICLYPTVTRNILQCLVMTTISPFQTCSE